MLLAPQRVSGHLGASALRGPNVGMFSESLCNFISIAVSHLRLYCSFSIPNWAPDVPLRVLYSRFYAGTEAQNDGVEWIWSSREQKRGSSE